jgi:SNF2 family DNA or RNA helicase
MLHAVWADELVVFGHRGRVLDLRTIASLASTLFISDEPFQAIPVELDPPGKRQGTLQAIALRIPIASASEGFLVREWVPWKSLSPSLGWFAKAARLARGVVEAGLVVPALSEGTASWSPLVTDTVGSEFARLASEMPPVVGALRPELQPWQIASSIVHAFVNDAVRLQLFDIPIPDPAPGSRRAIDVVSRRALSALVTHESKVVTNSPAESVALVDVTAAIERWTRPASGRSPLADFEISLRVVPPSMLDTDHDESPQVAVPLEQLPWVVELLLAPAGDPSLLVPARDLDTRDAAGLLGLSVDAAMAAARSAGRRASVLAPALASAFTRAIPADAELSIEQVMTFLHEQAPVLERAGVRVLLPSWWNKRVGSRVRGAARPATDQITPAGLDVRALTTVDWRVVLDGEPLSEDDRGRLAAAKHELVHLRGRWVRFDAADVAKSLAVFRKRDEEATDPVGPLGLLALQADADSDLETSHEAPDWIAELLAGLPDDRLVPIDEPAGFVGTLRPYQRRGLGWLAFLDRLGLGGCLADDMGLGKTAQLLALLAHERTANPLPGPTIVICPLSVVHNWETETARFTPGLRTHVHHGPDRAKGEDLFAIVRDTDVLITTYAVAARDTADLASIGWRRMVADEAQQVKNPHTAAAKALRKIPARQKLALTGTPVENRLSELWSICDLVNPGLLGSEKSFRERFAVPIERNRSPEPTAALRTLVQPFLLRRSKSDRSLVPELPPKVEQVAWASLTKEQATLYQSVVDVLLTTLKKMNTAGNAKNDIDRRGTILAALTRLKQICNHPVHYLGDGGRLSGRSGKLTRFDELIDDLLDADERMLVFTQFREMGELLTRHFNERLGLQVPFLHGGVTKARRDRMVEKFQAGEGGPLLLVSLKAGGSGLNLTAASQVVHYDRWWNPAVEDQASDRAWRIGQQRTVLVHQMVCRGTIEERIHELMAAKRDLADRVIGTGEGFITELSTDEIRDLVMLRSES